MENKAFRITPSQFCVVNSRLSSRTDTGHGETDVDGRADTTEEELSLQEDLTVGDGDDLETSRFQ